MITSLIQAKYFLDPSVKGRTIDVSTTGGVVTLQGQVASDNERAQALLLARTTQGVQRVEDSLTLDASLAQPPLEPIASRPALPNVSPDASAPAVGTSAPQGAATSTGAAGAATSGTRTQDTTLESALQKKFAADAQLKAAGIQVSAKDGVVLVQGSVPTPAAKQRALTMARETEGAVQVVDRLSVASKR
jgi:osmotically-inducible protein OsmY